MDEVRAGGGRSRELLGIGLALALAGATLAALASRHLSERHAQLREELTARPSAEAERLAGALRDGFEDLLQRQSSMPFFLWAPTVLDRPELGALPSISSLASSFEDVGPELWFGIDERAVRGVDDRRPYLQLPGAEPAAPEALAAVEEAVDRWASRVDLDPTLRVADLVRPSQQRWDKADVLHFVRQRESDPQALGEIEAALDELERQPREAVLDTVVGAFAPASAAGDGRLLVVVREVVPVPRAVGDPTSSTDRFLESLAERVDLLQGAVYDVGRLVDGLLREELANLPADVSISRGPRAPDGAELRSALQVDDALGLARLGSPGASPTSTELLWVTVDPSELRSRLRREWWTLHGILAASLLLAGAWLWSSLRRLARHQRRADRIGNFVAAVTHEFRTPLSTIALHAEMLLDGWAADAERQREYHQRIASETSRLSRLVERILEQSQLTRGRAQAPPAEPHVDDLSRTVEQLVPRIEAGAPTGISDVRFELAEDLPPVRLTPEAIESIVTNLVENARKYALGDAGGSDEPILVRTTRGSDGVRLEVLDRGPGIPEAEQRRVFEAFYRVGNEATRTTTGTGLGLHLVELQTRGLGGRVEALTREGGGCCIRLVLPPA